MFHSSKTSAFKSLAFSRVEALLNIDAHNFSEDDFSYLIPAPKNAALSLRSIKDDTVKASLIAAYIVSMIDRIVDRFGNVKDNASPELAEIRRALSSMTGTINAAMRRVISRATKEGYLESDTTPSVRDGRLVIPVSPMYKRKINGIVHDESASGKTVFIEPAEIVEANNRVRELQMDAWT